MGEAALSTFAANRAAGRIVLSVAATGAGTRRRTVYEEGPLRVRFPNAAADALEAVICNTAGGIAGGDQHDLDITAEEGAALSVTTAAAEKVYRAMEADSRLSIKLTVSGGARLAWLPQETILFNRARLRRSIDVEIADNATLLMTEAIVFGRSAMGEAVEEGAVTDRWRVRRGGKLAFAETIRLHGAIARALSERAVAAGGVAVATVLAIPGDEAMVGRVRGQTYDGEVGASAWNGFAVARLCGNDGASVRRDLAGVIAAMGGTLPRLWLG